MLWTRRALDNEPVHQSKPDCLYYYEIKKKKEVCVMYEMHLIPTKQMDECYCRHPQWANHCCRFNFYLSSSYSSYHRNGRRQLITEGGVEWEVEMQSLAQSTGGKTCLKGYALRRIDNSLWQCYNSSASRLDGYDIAKCLYAGCR